MKADELIEEVRDSAKEVYEKLGGGFEERVYRDALATELEIVRGIRCTRERSIDLYYKDHIVGLGAIDLLVGDEERVGVELKRKGRLTNVDKSQLRVYLDSMALDPDLQDIKKGLLINFQYGEEEVEKIGEEPEIALMEIKRD